MSNGAAERQSSSPHRLEFLKNWIKDPIGVASIVPSGRNLARCMAADVSADARVVELGAGTGTLTRALLARGVAPERLHIVEQNRNFVQILRMQFPGASVHEIDAADVATHLGALVGKVDVVVSGLPILWFERAHKLRVLGAAFELLSDDGAYYQFTYMGRPPVGGRMMRELRITAKLLRFAPLNLPPAFVYRFERRASTQMC